MYFKEWSGYKTLAKLAAKMPLLPGIYRMMDSKGKIMYIGKAKNIRNRVKQYKQVAGLPSRLQRMVSNIHDIDIMVTESEREALLLEANLIKKHRPPYNIALKDDKNHPYIFVDTSHDFPRIMKHRGSKKAKGKYFGPFASGYSVNHTMTILQKAFLLRSCNDHVFENRSRPCLLYQIKRCSAPCVDKITKDDYAKLIKDASEFLKGKSRRIQDELVLKMQHASEHMQYEQAALFRDRIRALNHIQSSQDINIESLGDTDIMTISSQANVCCIQVCSFRGGRNFGNQTFFPQNFSADMPLEQVLASFVMQYYTNRLIPKQIFLNLELVEEELIISALSEWADKAVKVLYPKRGQKYQLILQSLQNTEMALARHLSEKETQTKLLKQLQEHFEIEDSVERIEVYDNSHISGKFPYGVMIVAGKDGFHKNEYRKFKIKMDQIESEGDDYAMMRQVFKRRYSKALEDENAVLPNLIIVDGGKGQLSSACSILADLGLDHLPIVSMAKGPDRNAGREVFYFPDGRLLELEKNDPLLYFLQKLRDESHRFAIGTHRHKRKKSLTNSILDSIPGIGKIRKRKLLLHFGSAKAVENAKLSELQKVEGINQQVAEKIYNAFHEQD